MHYHCEVIMPNSGNIEKSLDEILAPFSENLEDYEDHSGHSFYDWYVVGGRWAGTKETCTYSAEKIKQFYKEIQEKNITVSGLTAGKQRLEPESQIPIVDGIWNKLFPTENGETVPCPLFAHSNNQYDSDDLISCDISGFGEIPENLKCSRVIIAGPSHDDSKLEAKFMLCDSEWNGVNHMPVDWDGKVTTAINKFTEHHKNYQKEYVEKVTPKSDWICVTVDYHS